MLDSLETAPSAPRTKPRLTLALLGVCVVIAALAVLRFALGNPTGQDVFGTRLGASAGDTRDRFHAPAPGSWTSANEPEPVLRWSPSGAASPIHQATFEFHDGMLVAERFDLDKSAAEASGPDVQVTRGAVVGRVVSSDEHVHLSVISRGCPQHREEIERLLSKAGSSAR